MAFRLLLFTALTLSLARETRAHEWNDPIGGSTGGEQPANSEPPPTGDQPAPESSAAYHSVTVGSSNDEPAETWRLERDEISGGDRTSADQLRRVPGVVVQRHATEGKGEQFLVRGFDAAHGTDVEVTLEGIPLNSASHIHGHGYIDLSWIPVAAVRYVDWNAGSFDLRQGSFATAGTINLELGGFETSEVGYRTSSTLRQQVWARYVDPEKPDHHWVVTEFAYDRGYGEERQILRGSVLAETTILDTRDVEVTAQLGASASEFDVPAFVKRADLRADRLDFYDAYPSRGDGAAQTAWFAFPFTVRTEQRWRLDGHAALDFRRFELDSNTTGFLIDPEQGDRRQIEDERFTIRTQLAARKLLMPNLQLRLFTSASTTLMSQREDRVGLEDQLIVTDRALDGALTTVGAGAAVRWFASDQWTIKAGLRLEYLRFDVEDETIGRDREFHDDGFVPLPRTSISWNLTDTTELVASYGRGLRPWEAQAIVPREDEGLPDSDLADIQPDPTITDHVELAVGYQIDAFILRAAAFGIFSADEYYFDHVARESASLGRTRRLGGEVALTAKPFEWWRIDLTALAVDARLLERAEDRVPAVPIFNGQFDTRFGEFAGVSFGATGRFVSKRELLYGAESAGYFVLDADVEWKHRGWRVWVGVENITGTEFAEAEYSFASAHYPDVERSQIPGLHIAAGPPRIVHGGISYEF